MSQDKILIGIDLASSSEILLELLLEESSDPDLFSEIVKANMHRPEILEKLMANPDMPDEVSQQIAQIIGVSEKPKKEKPKLQQPPEQKAQTILQKIQKLSVSERILLSLRGGKEVRTILLRDPNKEVALNVLENPKITEPEIEMIARLRSISEDALRKITKKREWIKNYNVVYALVTNPKTPASIAIQLVTKIKTKDLALLEKNRNVSEGVRVTAKKLLRARKAH
jgi:uncharacterized alpha-E superfamily protein